MFTGEGWYYLSTKEKITELNFNEDPYEETHIGVYILSSEHYDLFFSTVESEAGEIKAHQLVKAERFKAMTVHGYTPQWQYDHPEYYENNQMYKAAMELMQTVPSHIQPLNWDRARWKHLRAHSHQDRLIIAAQFLCAQYDYNVFKESKKQNS